MAVIYTYPLKSSPVDDDLLLISDSADENKTKRITVDSIRGATTSGVSQIVAGTNVTISPPTGTGVVTINSSGGGGGTPGGSDTQMQYNNAGAFGGTTGLTWDNSTNILSIGTRFEGDIDGALLQKVLVKEPGGVNKGDVVFISGGTGDNPEVRRTRANSVSYMPALGIMKDNTAEDDIGECVTSGEITGLNLTGFTTGDELFVSDTTAGGLLTSAPTGEANLVQKIGKVIKGGTGGALTVLGAFRTNATPNLNQGSLFIGNGSNQASTLAIGSNTHVLTSNGTTASWQAIPASGVTSFTNAFGTYITGTANTSATGAVTIGTIDLNAVDGTAIASTRFLSKDNTWDVPAYTVYNVASSTTNGLMKIADDTEQSVAANAVTSESGRTYGIQFNSDDQAVVNVPWTDTNTTDITLTTSGTTGASTWNGTTLNIPQYSTPPAGSTTQIQFNNSGSFGASANLTFSSNTLSAQDLVVIKGDGGTTPGKLRINCRTNSHYVEVAGPEHTGMVASYELELPNAAPTSNQILQASGTGALSWINTPSDTNTNIANANLTLNATRTTSLDDYNLNITSDNVSVGATGGIVRFQNWSGNASSPNDPVAVRVDKNAQVDGQAYVTLHSKGTVTGNVSIDWNDSNVQEMTLGGNVNLTQANCKPGGTYILIVNQDAEALNTITWSSDFDWMDNNTAPGAITAARTDLYSFVCRTATSLLGTYAEDFIV